MTRSACVLTCAALLAVSSPARSQAPVRPVPRNTNLQVLTQQGFQSTLPVVKEVPARPQRGPEGIDAMVEISSIDGEFEVIAGQSRLLILKRDLAKDGKVRAVAAVGQPAVIDFDVIHSRLIRLVGRRVGSTDLTLLTDDNQSYTFRVSVVYDLDTLRSRLTQVFPAVQIPLRQDRETIIVTGMARDSLEERNALRMTGSQLNAEQSVLLGRSSGGAGSAPAGGNAAGNAAGNPANAPPR